MQIDRINVGQELLNVPMPQMVRSMALAIAEGQWELDKSSMTVSELMSGQRLVRNIDTGELVNKLPDGSPRIIDSRVLFGYTYEMKQDEGGIVYDDKGDPVVERVPQKVSMMELGFTPNFYQFVDTIIEVKIAITMTGETSQVEASTANTEVQTESTDYRSTYNGSWWYCYGGSSHSKTQRQSVSTAQVDASYAARYSYSVEGSSLLRTRLVPVPPPAILEERIRQVAADEKAFQEKMRKIQFGEPTKQIAAIPEEEPKTP